MSYFDDWYKPFTRDVTKFATQKDNSGLKFDTPFYLFGLQIIAYAHRQEEVTFSYDGDHNPDPYFVPSIKDVEGSVRLQVTLIFEDGTEKKIAPFVMTGYIPNESYIATASTKNVKLLNESKKVKSISITNLDAELEGSVSVKRYKDGVIKVVTQNGVVYYIPKWGTATYVTTRSSQYKLLDIKAYERPQKDSGMRIQGDGIIYTPAETEFPSPLRIYHNGVKNIMLVPKGCDYASVFKIKTEEGYQAITTLID